MADLQIIITGENQSGPAFNQLKQDAGDVEQGFDKAKQTGTGFFSGLLQTAGGFLAANVLGSIAGQLTSFVGDGIAAAQDTAKLMAATENIIKNTGGAAGISAEQVADLASSLSDAAGKSLFGDDQIQGAENVLLKYKELKGIIPGVTQLSVDMAQSLGKDPAAAAEFLGRALQKPENAAALLAKQGIILTDQQKTMIKTMTDAGDTAGAQKFLMDQLNSTYAGSAQSAAGAAGGMVQFKARMGEVGESVGAALLPLLNKLGKMLSDDLAPVIEEVANWLGVMLPKAIDIAAKFWTSTLQPALNAVWKFVSSNLIPIIDELTKWLQDNLPPALQELADYWEKTLLPALSQVWAFIQDNIIPIINTLIKVWFALMKTEVQALAALWVNVLWPALQKVWQFIVANIIPILAELLVWLKDNLPPFIQAMADLWNNTLLPALTVVWDFINKYVLPILAAIGKVVEAVIIVQFNAFVDILNKNLIPAFTSIYNYVDKNIIPILDKVGKFIMSTVGPAFSWLGERLSPIVMAFSNMSGYVDGLINSLDQLAEKIKKIHMPKFSLGGGGDDSGGNATGTMNFRGGMTLVGEHGPEMVRLPKGSQINTASDTRQMLAAAGGRQEVIITINDNGADWLMKIIDMRIDQRTRSSNGMVRGGGY